MKKTPGMVYLVGAGPGDPGLITVRGFDLLRSADVVVHDRLIGRELLAVVRSEAEIIDVGKEPDRPCASQAQINDLLVDRARGGAMVVRLKGGDPHVFGRAFEEMAACRQADVDCVVIPGVTSAIAAPAAVNIPITNRHHVRSVAFVTARVAAGSTAPPLDYGALARIDTVCVLMGRAKLREFTRLLIEAGRDAKTPAACVESATTPRQRLVTGTLATIANQVDAKGVHSPVVTVIGAAAAFAEVDSEGTRRPLSGKRVLLLRPCREYERLRRRLSVGGTTMLPFATVRVDYPEETPELDQAIIDLHHYSWIVYRSVHAVSGFFRRLTALGHDARALARCRIAATGRRVADQLRQHGIVPDLSLDGLAPTAWREALFGNNGHLVRVLLPSRDESPDRRVLDAFALDGRVRSVVAYRIIGVPPTQVVHNFVACGLDAVVLGGPQAVKAMKQLDFARTEAVRVCLGRSTASAARSAGLPIDLLADDPTDLVHRLADRFGGSGERGTGRVGPPVSAGIRMDDDGTVCPAEDPFGSVDAFVRAAMQPDPI